MNQETCKIPGNRRLHTKQRVLAVASGREKADLVLKNTTYVNVFTNGLSHGDIAVAEGLIAGVGETYSGEVEVDMTGLTVLPGLIDGHIHLESALVSPAEFARAVLPHGTTTVVTDPHEIANVMGSDGIEYILQATEGLPLEVFLMLPSCVPATSLDESGAVLDYRNIDFFYQSDRVLGLAEVMDANGVVNSHRPVLEKIASAQVHHKLIDGHVPHLSGHELNAYISAGIYSDHECSTLEEALEKMARGQHIMIREGTAARNLDALMPLLQPRYHANCLFCTDDIHPIDLLKKGHIDYIIRRALRAGVDPIIAVKCATLHTARYFGLRDRGAIAPGFLADFAVVDNLEDFNLRAVYKRGALICDGERLTPFQAPEIEPELLNQALNTFHLEWLTEARLAESQSRAVLTLLPGEIITGDGGYANRIDVDRDILKIIVAERHRHTNHVGIGYIQGYGLKRGAVATSVSHDSHNIIAVGVSEAEIAAAVNRVAQLNGGIVVWEGDHVVCELPLQLAGLMSLEPLTVVDEKLEAAKAAAFRLGVNPGIDPFMTLSFTALPVIPTLRLTTRGVFDVVNQRFT